MTNNRKLCKEGIIQLNIVLNVDIRVKLKEKSIDDVLACSVVFGEFFFVSGKYGG